MPNCTQAARRSCERQTCLHRCGLLLEITMPSGETSIESDQPLEVMLRSGLIHAGWKIFVIVLAAMVGVVLAGSVAYILYRRRQGPQTFVK